MPITNKYEANEAMRAARLAKRNGDTATAASLWAAIEQYDDERGATVKCPVAKSWYDLPMAGGAWRNAARGF